METWSVKKITPGVFHSIWITLLWKYILVVFMFASTLYMSMLCFHVLPQTCTYGCLSFTWRQGHQEGSLTGHKEWEWQRWDQLQCPSSQHWCGQHNIKTIVSEPTDSIKHTCSLLRLSLSPSLSLSLSLSLSQSSLSLCSGCLASVRSCEEMIHQVQAKRKLLKEQVKKAMDDFKQLLDTRQAVSTHTVLVVLS